MPLATAREALRPPLKWAGGKRWQVPHLAPLWKPYEQRRLVEPFCGGLAVALGLKPATALLNDANPHLVNFYTWLQRGLRVTIPMENDERLFYRHRDRFNTMLGAGDWASEEAASLFYYLNRTGFNGLCRFNRRGLFNVPFGRYSRIRYTRDFGAYRDALSKWTFTSGDVESLPLEPGDFVYADPPYRRRVHTLLAWRVYMARSGADGPLAFTAPRPRRARQSGHGSDGTAVCGARIRGAFLESATAHQLHRRSNAGARSWGRGICDMGECSGRLIS